MSVLFCDNIAAKPNYTADVGIIPKMHSLYTQTLHSSHILAHATSTKYARARTLTPPQYSRNIWNYDYYYCVNYDYYMFELVLRPTADAPTGCDGRVCTQSMGATHDQMGA